MADARAEILARLRAAGGGEAWPEPDTSVLASRTWPPAERMARLRRGMEAVHTEFLEAAPGQWPGAVLSFCRDEGLATLLYGPSSAAGKALATVRTLMDPELIPYAEPMETFKETLFSRVDAGFTTAQAGVAETGGILLEPGPEEPRLLSLVPPVHIALLLASTIEDSLWSAMRNRGWGKGAARNSLLISGPSKTADIEQTLAYGVHGPKRLVVVLVNNL
jgi:L-lactate dehydrogenase complex protein LldG